MTMPPGYWQQLAIELSRATAHLTQQLASSQARIGYLERVNERQAQAIAAARFAPPDLTDIPLPQPARPLVLPNEPTFDQLITALSAAIGTLNGDVVSVNDRVPAPGWAVATVPKPEVRYDRTCATCGKPYFTKHAHAKTCYDCHEKSKRR